MKSNPKTTTVIANSLTADDAGLDGPTHVGAVMTKKPMTMMPDESFAELVGRMANRAFRHMLVVDEDQRLHGVISDRDVLRALSRTPDWNQKSVAQIMSQDSITTTPDSAISAAVRTMLDKRINCLPVIGADGRVAGILTSTDLLQAYEQLQKQVEQRPL